MSQLTLHSSRRSLFTAFIVCVVCGLSAVADEPALQNAEQPPQHTSNSKIESPRILVLLVGVSHYPTLKKRQQLEGPYNDTALVESVLETSFHQQIAHKVVLRENQPDHLLPTHANIERECQRLAEVARPGDQVLILLAGHGSQQPDQADADENDALDEIFLPRDIGVWKDAVGTVENAISDDQIRNWLLAIRQKGAFVFFIADSCHSGTIARGDAAVSRFVPSEDLGIPISDHKSADGLQKESSFDIPGGFVALYASQSDELTYEDRIPKNSDQRHGWLTWAFCESLHSYRGTMSYADLARRISWQYERFGWRSSHPQIDGTDLRREILGTRSFDGIQPTLLSVAKSGILTLNVGRLHGLGPGTILEVLGPDKSVAGHVRISDSRAVESVAVSVEYDGVPLNAALSSNSECSVVYHDFGDQTLSVAVDVSLVAPENQRELRQRIETQLTSVMRENNLPLGLSESLPDSDWLIIVSNDCMAVHLTDIDDVERMADGTVAKRSGAHWITISTEQAALKAGLNASFATIIAARNLRTLATLDPGMDGVVSLELKVEKLADPVKQTFEPVSESNAVVKDKDRMRVLVRNTSRRAVDLTILYVANDSSIKCFFPKTGVYGVNNRLVPMEVHHTPEIEINDTTVGLEDLIVIAVEAAGAVPVSFGFLAQTGVREISRSKGDGGHPLDRLLKSSDCEDQKTRGGPVKGLGGYAIHRFSWTVEKPH